MWKIWRDNFLFPMLGMTIIYLLCAVLLPLPVHKVNRCCSASECEVQYHHSVPRLSDSSLKIYYDELNHDFYLDQLPKDTEVKWGDLTAQDYMGLTDKLSSGRFVITVDRATHVTNSETKMTVAHETCHIKTWGTSEIDHGPKFQACMVNLATHGAFEGIW
jgi:hypothetical protein